MNCPECGKNVTEAQLAKTMGQCPYCAMIVRLPPSDVLKNANPFRKDPVPGKSPGNPFGAVNDPVTPERAAELHAAENPDLPAQDVPTPPPVPTIHQADEELSDPLGELFVTAKAELRGGPLDGAVAHVSIFKEGKMAGQWPNRFSTAKDATTKRKHWYTRVGNSSVYKYEKSENS